MKPQRELQKEYYRTKLTYVLSNKKKCCAEVKIRKGITNKKDNFLNNR